MINKKLMTRALVLGTALALSGGTIAGVMPVVNTGIVAFATETNVTANEEYSEAKSINKDDVLVVKNNATLTLSGVLTVHGTLKIEKGSTVVVTAKDNLVLGSVSGDQKKIINEGTIEFAEQPTAGVATTVVDNSGEILVDGESVVPTFKLLPKAKENLEYTKTKQVIAETGVLIDEASGCSVYYAVVASGAAAPADSDYKATLTDDANKVTNAGKYEIYYKIAGTSDWANVAPKKIEAEIAKAEIEISGATGVTKVYDGKNTVTDGNLTFKDKNDSAVSLTKASGTTFAGASEDYMISGTYADANVGTGKSVNVKVTVNENSDNLKNYKLKSTSYTGDVGEITKATNSVTVSKVDSLTYNGNSQKLVKIDAEPKFGQLEYQLGDDGDWSTAIPEAINANTTGYKVIYRVKADPNGNYEGVSAQTITGIAIGKATIPGFVGSFTTNIENVDGGTVTVTLPELPAGVKYGTPTYIKEDSKYTVAQSGASGNTITVTQVKKGDITPSLGITVPVNVGDNYSATSPADVTITVTPSDKVTQTIVASNKEFTYGDKNIDLGVTVTGKPGGPNPEAPTYTSDTTSVLNFVDGKPVINGQGTAKVTITANADSTYAAATRVIVVTVKKKPIKVKIKDREILKGDPEPTFGQKDWSIVGDAAEGERVKTGSLTFEVDSSVVTDTDTAGVFKNALVKKTDLKFEKIEGVTDTSGNYEIEYENGTLTIVDPDAPTPTPEQADLTASISSSKTVKPNVEAEFKVTATVKDGWNLSFAWTVDGIAQSATGDTLKVTRADNRSYSVVCVVTAKKAGQTDATKQVSATLVVNDGSTPAPQPQPVVPSGGGSSGGSSYYPTSNWGGSSVYVPSPAVNRPATNNNQNNNQNQNQNNNQNTPSGSSVPVSAYAHADAGRAMPIIRMFNPASGEHIITTNTTEASALEALHGWKREAVSGNSSVANNSPVYRMFHAASGKHIYTMTQKEIDALVAQGWTNEGVLFFAGGQNVVMYRLFNPNLPAAVAHHYTTDEGEYNTLGGQGWQQEGVAFRLD